MDNNNSFSRYVKKTNKSEKIVSILLISIIFIASVMAFFDIFGIRKSFLTADINLSSIIAFPIIALMGIAVIFLIAEIRNKMKGYDLLGQVLEQTNKMLYVLTNIQEALILSKNEPIYISQICKILVEIGGFSFAWAGYAEQNESKAIKIAAKSGHGDGFLEKVQFCWDAGKKNNDPVSRAIIEKQPVMINDISSDPICALIRDEALKRSYKSMAVLPIIYGNKLLGVIGIFSADATAFENENMQFLNEMSNSIANGIIFIREQGKLASERDALEKQGTESAQSEVAAKPQDNDIKEEEAKARAIFEYSREFICILNPYSMITDANSAMIKQLGYDRSELIGKRIETFLTEESKQIFPEQFQILLKTGFFRKEMEFYAKDRKKLNCECFVTSVKDSKGEIEYVILYNKDNTESKNLLFEITKYKSLADATTVALGLVDLTGVLLYSNDVYDNLNGSQKAELVGKPVKIIEENKNNIKDALLKNNFWETELVIKSKNGKKIPVICNVKNFSDKSGNVCGFVIVLNNISEIREAERLLDESEDRFNTVFEKGPFGMALVGLDYRVLNIKKVNKMLCSMLDYPEQSLLSLRIPDITYTEDIEMDIDNSKKLFVGEIPYYRVMKRFFKKNKDIFWANVTSFIVRDKRMQPLYRLLFFEDVTDWKQDQQRMEQIVADLQRSNAELEQFAYISSHDLQEPLRMITSYVQLLEKRYKTKLDADAIDFINFISDGAIRMHRLIQDLLEYSRVTTRGKPLEPVDTSVIFEEAIANLKTAIEESGAVIVHDNLPTVVGDPSQLAQLFQNLIGNSIKFRHKNDPVNRFPHIYISVTKTKGDWLFSFRDNGIGFDAQYSERIFMIFQRLHSKAEYPGTGIGLSICRKIVGRHGGRIWAVSEPSAGSTFYFTIPIKGRVDQ